ncbi:MAG: elongation factor G [Planctomycetota bacterium]
MAATQMDKIRNIGIIAHIDAGKTTTTERILLYSGKEHRAGDVDDGNTTTDWMQAERERGITITSAAVSFEWDGHWVNLIDTPGHVDFTVEVERSLRVLDGAVFVFDSVAGVQAQSETVWRQARRYRVPCIALINKMDRTGADFERAVESIEKRLNANPIIIQIPHIDEESRQFLGIIDLIEREYLVWPKADDKDDQGRTWERQAVPAELVDEMELARDTMLDKLGSVDDRVADAYLMSQESGERVESSLIRDALRKGTIAMKFVPVMCGSSLRNKGVQPLLDAVISYLPAPPEVNDGVAKGINPKTEHAEVRKLDTAEAFAALAFKTFSTKNFELTYLRVYSGHIKKGEQVLNAGKNKKERLTQLWRMFAMDKEALDEIRAGDIIACTGLQDTTTGDTLCNVAKPIMFESITFPHTVVQMAIEPKTSADKDKLDKVLKSIAREDPSFEVRIDKDSGQQIICGMGELHLEVIKDRMEDEFKVSANVGKPTVSYKETINGKAEADGEYHRQTGDGNELRAAVSVRIEPATDLVGVDAVKDPAVTKEMIPVQFHGPILAELKSALASGGGYGFPLVQARATLTGGKVFEGSVSNEIAFLAAANHAVREAVHKVGTQLLEPIMSLTVETPDEYVGDIQRDLSRRRAEINDMSMDEGMCVIKATVPIAEMFGYAKQIRSVSSGRASYSMEPLTYKPAPPEVSEKFNF